MEPTSRWDSPWVTRALTVAAIAPIVVALVHALAIDRMQIGDDGLLALRVDDVGSRHHPLLGSWTSASQSFDEDVNNPGAWYSYLAAPFVALFGPNAGAFVGVATLNVGAVVGISTAAGRLGSEGFRRWMLVAASGLAWAMGSALLIEIWQPHALLLPLLLALVLAVGVADGRMWFVVPFVAVVSIIVQTHLGHAVILGLVAISTCTIGAWTTRDRWTVSSAVRSRPLWLAVAIALVGWSPAIVEQVRYGRDGNVARLIRSVGDAEYLLGGQYAVQLVARILVLPPLDIRAAFARTPPNSPRIDTADGPTLTIEGLPGLAVSVIAIAAAVGVVVVLLRHARRTDLMVMRSSLSIALVAVIAAIAALSQIVVGPFAFATHHVRWLFAVAVFVQGVIAWAALAWARTRWPRIDAPAHVVPIVIVVAFSVWNLAPYDQQTGPTVDRWAEPTLREIEAQLDAIALPAPLLYVSDNLRLFEPYSGPVMALLGRQGVDFRVDDGGLIRQLGRGRAADRSEVGSLFQLQSEDVVLYDGDACVLAVASGVPDDVAAGGADLTASLTDGLERGEIVPDPGVLGDDERLELLSTALADGDDVAVRRLVLQGTLTDWAGLGALDPATTAAIERDGDDLADWVRSHFALYLDTDLPCPT